MIGAQWPQASKFVQFTHTIHQRAGGAPAEAKSESGKSNIAQVWLFWYSFHFLTGYVELNYRKDGGVEHPMWCIMSKKSHVAALTYRSVNELFMKLSPEIVNFVERVDLEEPEKFDEVMGVVSARKSGRTF